MANRNTTTSHTDRDDQGNHKDMSLAAIAKRYAEYLALLARTPRRDDASTTDQETQA